VDWVDLVAAGGLLAGLTKQILEAGLERVYPVVFIDAIVVKIRVGQVANRPVYAVIGVTVDAKRHVFGRWVGRGHCSRSPSESRTDNAVFETFCPGKVERSRAQCLYDDSDESSPSGRAMTARTLESIGHERLLRGRPSHPAMVEVPEATFLMIDGHGDPNRSPDYVAAVAALYAAAYTVKFALKKSTGRVEKMAPLEGLWWGAERESFAPSTKDFMINLAVDDLDGILASCARHGVEANVLPDEPNGRFAHIVDPEGTKVELWQPKPMSA